MEIERIKKEKIEVRQMGAEWTSTLLTTLAIVSLFFVVVISALIYLFIEKEISDEPIDIITPSIPLMIIIEDHTKKIRLLTLPEILTPLNGPKTGLCNYMQVVDDPSGFTCPAANEAPEKVVDVNPDLDPLGWLHEYILKFPLYDLGFEKTGSMDMYFVPWNPNDVLNPPNNFGSNFSIALSIIGGSIGRQKVRSPVLSSGLVLEITNDQQAAQEYGPGWIFDSGGAVYGVPPFKKTIKDEDGQLYFDFMKGYV